MSSLRWNGCPVCRGISVQFGVEWVSSLRRKTHVYDTGSFIVEHRDDGSVWLVIRAFSRPAGTVWWVGYPALRLMQAVFTSRYERSLTGPLGG